MPDAICVESLKMLSGNSTIKVQSENGNFLPAGGAGAVATLIHDGFMNPIDGEQFETVTFTDVL